MILDRGEKINIKDLSTEKIEQEIPELYDEEKYASDKMWSKMAQNLEWNKDIPRERDSMLGDLHSVVDLKILRPDKANEIPFSEKEMQEAFDIWKFRYDDNLYENEDESRKWRGDTKLFHLRKLKQINPDFIKQTGILEQAYDYFKQNCKRFIDNNKMNNLINGQDALNFILVYPDRFDELGLTLNEGEKKFIIKSLEKQKREILDSEEPGRITTFLHEIKKFKILFPDLDLGSLIDEEVVRAFNNRIKKSEEERVWLNVASYAALSKIISAEKIEVTENGLQLTMPEKKQDSLKETHALPKKRNY